MSTLTASLLPPLLLARLIDSLTAGVPPTSLAVLGYFGSLALEGLLSSAQESLLVLFGQKMTHALRSEMSRKLTMLPAGTLAGQNPGEVAFLQNGTLVIETYAVEDPAMQNGAIDHVALNVQDIEAAWSDAQACGYETEDKSINFLPFFERGVKFFTIIGPNREKVEFNQYL